MASALAKVMSLYLEIHLWVSLLGLKTPDTSKTALLVDPALSERSFLVVGCLYDALLAANG